MRQRARAGRSSRRRNEIIDEVSFNFVRMKKIDDAIRSCSDNSAVARRAGRARISNCELRAANAELQRAIDRRSRHRSAAVAVAQQPREPIGCKSEPWNYGAGIGWITFQMIKTEVERTPVSCARGAGSLVSGDHHWRGHNGDGAGSARHFLALRSSCQDRRRPCDLLRVLPDAFLPLTTLPCCLSRPA